MLSLKFKGGIAKTITATILAHSFATDYNKKVLIVDLDPQNNTTSLPDNSNLNILSVLL